MMGRAVFGAEKGGRWDGIQRGLGGEAKGKTERKEKGDRKERKGKKKTEQLREPGQSCWWRGNLQVRSPDTSYSITFSPFWLLDVKHRSVIFVDS